MQKKIFILDYGAGNLKSVQKAFAFLGYHAEISNQKKQLQTADILVLPGQGAFVSAMQNLASLDLTDLIKNHINNEKPYLGICLGLQLLFEQSWENGLQKGLGIFKGEVKQFQFSDNTSLKVPHMGWNNLALVNDQNQIFSKVASTPFVYFVHSYYVATSQSEIISTTTNYGLDFVSAIQTPHLLATQFHPEKSGSIGLKILENFLQKFN